jgi:hypothetical protein
MVNVMKIKFIVREEDLLETQMLIASKSKTLRKRRWTGTISILVCLLVFGLYVINHERSFDVFKIIVLTAISVCVSGLYFFAITPYIYRRHYVKHVKAHFANIIGNSVELQITDDFIETTDETGETRVKWTEIEHIYETGNLFIIQSNSNNYLTVAKQDIDPVLFRNSLTASGLEVEIIAQ